MPDIKNVFSLSGKARPTLISKKVMEAFYDRISLYILEYKKESISKRMSYCDMFLRFGKSRERKNRT